MKKPNPVGTLYDLSRLDANEALRLVRRQPKQDAEALILASLAIAAATRDTPTETMLRGIGEAIR